MYFDAFTFSSQIKRKRQQQGYSLRDLSAITELSISDISRIENGTKTNISIDTLLIMTNKLGISLFDALHIQKTDILDPCELDALKILKSNAIDIDSLNNLVKIYNTCHEISKED